MLVNMSNSWGLFEAPTGNQTCPLYSNSWGENPRCLWDPWTFTPTSGSQELYLYQCGNKKKPRTFEK